MTWIGAAFLGGFRVILVWAFRAAWLTKAKCLTFGKWQRAYTPAKGFHRLLRAIFSPICPTENCTCLVSRNGPGNYEWWEHCRPQLITYLAI